MSILRLLPCRVISVSKKEILLPCSSSIVKEILGSMLFKELRKLVNLATLCPYNHNC